MQNRLFKLLLIFLFSLTTTLGHATAGGKQAQAEAAILATLTETLVGALVGKGVGVVAIKGTQLSIQTAKVVVQKTRQTVKFSTDDLGRINKVEGKLNLDIKDRNSHQQNSQLITSMLNGPSGKTRLLSGNLNEGEWRKLEKEWMSALKEGKSVKVSVEPVYSGNSTRPESFKINYFIDDRLTQKVFQNTAPKGGTITQTTTGRTITQVPKGTAQRSLIETTRAIARKKAGFSDSGTPIILDTNLQTKGLADALRAKGFNVRSVSEIFGKDVGDPGINKLANTLGARVLTRDRGRQIGEGFGSNAIQVDSRVRGVDDIARILGDGL